MNKNTLELIPGYFYHIFNRGINKEKIFYNEGNYHYFLKKYDEYFSNFADTYAYCLLPNHFHLLVRIKDYEKDSIFLKDGIFTRKPGEQLRRFFISYSMSINKQQKRMGSLFIKNFKRKAISKDKYLMSLIFYIHFNPVHHKLINEFEKYKWSSYSGILSDKSTKLAKDYILTYFGGKENFKEFHKQIHSDKEIVNLIIE